MTKTILVVEDEQTIRELVKLLLEQHGYHILEAKDYASAVKQSQLAQFHLVLLDWMLPGGSGIEFIKYVRKQPLISHIPIIMLTARQHEDDQISSLNSGADDYITKPFSNKELLARINAILRRAYPENDTIIKFNDLKIDTQSHRVSVNNQEIELFPAEYKLLSFFMSKPERVFTREQLIDHVWGRDSYIDDRTVDVHVGRLRKQLEISGYHSYIQTIRGSGYRFSVKIEK
ncbi:phosphate regulon transcriptional regulator PhoB [Orbus sturtevantii]|uniref:phosphate regulon transcriptional regulator PhoB n=1 Tax=Orbus sturtevantii TaxID=3074109 RepID=UPI00370D57F7